MAITYGILSGTYTARQFADMFAPVIGDMVAGNGFALTMRTGLSVSIASGYGYADGHWIRSTSAMILNLEPAEAMVSRYDAVAITVNPTSRTSTLQILTDIDPNNITSEGVYVMPLYVMRVRAGATTLYEPDITDKRNLITTLKDLATQAISGRAFIPDGISAGITAMLSNADISISEAQADLSALNSGIETKRSLSIGTVVYAKTRPAGATKWLLCNGSAVPSGYTALIAVIGSTLPNLTAPDNRFSAYIYAGLPA